MFTGVWNFLGLGLGGFVAAGGGERSAAARVGGLDC